MHTKEYFFFSIAAFFLLLVFSMPFSVAAEGLVPCSNTLQNNSDGSVTIKNTCTACEIFTLAKNILDFIYTYITIPIVTVMFLWGGFLMLSGGLTGSPGNHQKGLKIMRHTLTGVVIIFCSWLATDTIIKLIAGQSLTGGAPAIIKSFGPWNEVKCEASKDIVFPPPSKPAPSPIPSPSPSPNPAPSPIPSLDALLENQQNAADLAARGVGFSSSGDCGGVSARTNLDELRNARPLSICFSGCTQTSVCNRNTDGRTADPRMLEDLVFLNEMGYNYQVSSIATGDHSPTSDHYKGKGIDLTPKGSTTFGALRDAMSARNPTSQRVTCEDNSGAITSCGSGTTHVHVSYP